MKKCLPLLLCLTLLFCLCAPTAAAEPVRTVTIELPRYAAPAATTRDYSAAAAHILDSLKEGKNPVDVSKFHIPKEDALSVFVGLLSDHPEFFYIKTGLSYTYNPLTGYLIDITYFNTVSDEELESQKAALETAAQELLSGLRKDMTETEKILYLHDTLALRIDYDYENYNAGTLPDASYTAYGAIVNGVAVCQGYSMAFIYLAKQVGIESCFVSSDTMNHGWNAVRADGKWYYMDITHDDAVLSMSGSYIYNSAIGHNRFLLNESELTAAGYSTDRQIVSVEHSDVACPEPLPEDGLLWQEQEAGAFFYFDGLWYYAEGELVYSSKIDGSEKAVFYDAGKNGMYAYSRLVMQGQRIYYNTRESICTVDPASGLVTTLAAEEDGSIVGLGLRPDGRLVYEGFDSANQYYKRFISVDFLEADAVLAQISALPWYVTEENRSEVEAARAAYSMLTSHQRQQISNLFLLEEAERVLGELAVGTPFQLGDVNRDRIISVSDVVALRRIILLNGDDYVYSFTDVDGDGALAVSDVVALRQMILNAA